MDWYQKRAAPQTLSRGEILVGDVVLEAQNRSFDCSVAYQEHDDTYIIFWKGIHNGQECSFKYGLKEHSITNLRSIAIILEAKLNNHPLVRA